ncbi:CRISPR-associated protein Cas4 [Succinimonas sp.]|uniref:CRISPR-associated protein Cas4 n=1 Tax=Succinimonas sp. TaxID=1936151 RepID=UPI003866FCCF
MCQGTLVPISAIQHYSYCPRQYALIHLFGVWNENYLTASGRSLHERVDSHEFENRNNIKYQRSLFVSSQKERIYGRLDLLEYDTINNTYTPVEYKRGHPKIINCDKLQLCAQALAVSETTGTYVYYGFLWYFEIRRRIKVEITDSLIKETRSCVENILDLISKADSGNEKHLLPSAKKYFNSSRCSKCSLFVYCQPKQSVVDHSKQYIESYLMDDL